MKTMKIQNNKRGLKKNQINTSDQYATVDRDEKQHKKEM